MVIGKQVISVVAIRPFEYHGRQIHPNEGVEMPLEDVALYTRKGYLSFDPRRRPTYQTRELVAEPVQQVAVMATTEPLPEPEPEPVLSVKRRRGRPRKHPLQ